MLAVGQDVRVLIERERERKRERQREKKTGRDG
jgi:hypothetical protein